MPYSQIACSGKNCQSGQAVPKHHLGAMSHTCTECGAHDWLHEATETKAGQHKFNMCSQKGAIQLPALQSTPPVPKALLQGDTPESRGFLAKTRKYNSRLAMASTGRHFNQCLQSKSATKVYTVSTPAARKSSWYVAGVQNLNSKYGGVHRFCVGHCAYHMIGLDRLPPGTRTTFLQLFIYDQDELHDRMALRVAQKLNRDVMQALQAELHLVNPYVRRFKAVNPGN